jgi:hypothetical protein
LGRKQDSSRQDGKVRPLKRIKPHQLSHSFGRCSFDAGIDASYFAATVRAFFFDDNCSIPADKTESPEKCV